MRAFTHKFSVAPAKLLIGSKKAIVLHHFLVLSSVNFWRPMTTLVRYKTSALWTRTTLPLYTDVFRSPADDVDVFCNQIRSTVTAVLDTLAPLKTRTKRRGKRNS